MEDVKCCRPLVLKSIEVSFRYLCHKVDLHIRRYVGIGWFLSVRHVVVSFNYQNVSAPKGLSSVSKKGTNLSILYIRRHDNESLLFQIYIYKYL